MLHLAMFMILFHILVDWSGGHWRTPQATGPPRGNQQAHSQGQSINLVFRF